jgi:hypothetical protein
MRNGKPAKLLAPYEYVKNSHTGIYDQTILCEECERRLSAPDDYAQEILLATSSQFKSVVVDRELVVEQLTTYNYTLLHRFILAVLWRASASSHDFFKKVDLGPHQTRIKAIAFDEQASGDEYPFWAGRLDHDKKNNMIPAPIPMRIEGVNYWGVYVGDFHFYVKVDNGRRTPPSIVKVHASPGNPLLIVCRDLIGSPEYVAAKASADLRKIGKT